MGWVWDFEDAPATVVRVDFWTGNLPALTSHTTNCPDSQPPNTNVVSVGWKRPVVTGLPQVKTCSGRFGMDKLQTSAKPSDWISPLFGVNCDDSVSLGAMAETAEPEPVIGDADPVEPGT
mmetsp:Transcript_22885/g.63669  ORF Transcript_22885/g.63669 Transcript_22885/m.63669 type:complete len:120 (+) Transcript_22885:223-582(+)